MYDYHISYFAIFASFLWGNLKRINQKQLCYAEKSPTDKLDIIHLQEEIIYRVHCYDYSAKNVIMLPWTKSHKSLLHFCQSLNEQTCSPQLSDSVYLWEY